ncbi:MAG: FtsQ-type POTRA domain-containing protein [Acidobacteria bacterium]|jgi:cell division septal protein FtsQ|nr:FtsQ-type POTRA domain-containing protein [Acidobacteriota bacterium]
MAIQKTTPRRTNAAKRPRKRAAVNRRKTYGKFANFFVPLFFVFGILVCLGVLALMGYRTVTASTFFDVKTIDVRGLNRASKDDIEKIVSRQTEKSGVWNADLNVIKTDVERLTFVKSAVVSRVLPDGLRVSVRERVPRVIAKMKAGDFWADEESVILGAVGKDEARPPFVLRGWDESKTEKAAKDNQERVKIYLKMLNEWQDFELARRVSSVNLADLQDPQAIVQDSGENITVSLGKENFAKRLQKALEVVANKGTQIEAIISNGQNVIVKYRS